jgi:hypothetical protein
MIAAGHLHNKSLLFGREMEISMVTIEGMCMPSLLSLYPVVLIYALKTTRQRRHRCVHLIGSTVVPFGGGIVHRTFLVRGPVGNARLVDFINRVLMPTSTITLLSSRRRTAPSPASAFMRSLLLDRLPLDVFFSVPRSSYFISPGWSIIW